MVPFDASLTGGPSVSVQPQSWHSLKITTEEEHPFSLGDTVHLSQFKEGPSNNGWAYVAKIVDTRTILVNKMKSNNLIPVLDIDGDHGIEPSSWIKVVRDTSLGDSSGSVTISNPEGYSTSADGQVITVSHSIPNLDAGDVIHFENGGIFTLNTDADANATTLNGVLSEKSVSNHEMGYVEGYDAVVTLQTLRWMIDTMPTLSGVIRGGEFFELPSSEPSDAEIDSSKPPFVKFQEPASGGLYAKTTFMDRKNNIWIYRGPQVTHDAEVVNPATFTVTFYYKTLEGFWFPGRSGQPVVGQTLGGIAGEVGAARGEAGPGDADSIAEGLRSFGDAAVVAELIDLFLQDAPARLAQAREALAAGDAAEIGESAHSLKGSARNLRAEQLAKACEALEKMGKTGTLDDVETLLGQAEVELQKVTTLLKQQKKALGQAG